MLKRHEFKQGTNNDLDRRHPQKKPLIYFKWRLFTFLDVFLHGFEPRSSESESEVLTVTPQENIRTYINKTLSVPKGHQLINFQHFVSLADLSCIHETVVLL